jgi:hypothetical protein
LFTDEGDENTDVSRVAFKFQPTKFHKYFLDFTKPVAILTRSKFGSRKMAGTFDMLVNVEEDDDVGRADLAGEIEARVP